MAIHPSGHYLYVGNWYLARIGAFSIGGSGGLAPVNGTPLNTPFVSAPKPGGSVSLAIDPSGQFLYAVSTESNQITGFSINQNTGALSQLGGPLLLPTGKHPFRVVVSP